MVFAFDGYSVKLNTELGRSCARQLQLHEGVRKLSGKPIPAQLLKQPDAYLIVKDEETANGLRRTVGLWNLLDDEMLMPKIRLDRYFSSITFIGDTKGTLNGDTVCMKQDVPAHGFVGFVVDSY